MSHENRGQAQATQVEVKNRRICTWRILATLWTIGRKKPPRRNAKLISQQRPAMTSNPYLFQNKISSIAAQIVWYALATMTINYNEAQATVAGGCSALKSSGIFSPHLPFKIWQKRNSDHTKPEEKRSKYEKATLFHDIFSSVLRWVEFQTLWWEV